MGKCKRKSINTSSFICSRCGKLAYQLPRIHSQREKHHVKTLYCPWCKDIEKCTEIRSFEVYKTLSGEVIGLEDV